jgi:uncharacterized protein YdhG (YjbR/CyaY superfamily)
MAKVTYATVDDYIRAQPADAHTVLRTVRGIIRNALPTAEEVISYQIPAYRVGGRIVLYFAGWRDHYSLYPASKALEEKFRKELAPYETSGRGTIRFPMDRRIPSALIAKIARFRVAESAARAKANASKTSKAKTKAKAPTKAKAKARKLR